MVDRNVVIRLRGDIGDFQAKMVAASKSVSATANKMTGAEKEAVKFRQGLTDIGNAAGKVGLAAAAGLAVAVKAFADFDQAMSGVEAATHATKQEMDSLRQLALQTGADTAFSAIEAADGIEQLAKAGVSTAEIMGGALQGSLDLAAAGTVEVGFAAEAAAGAMAQFGLAGSEVPHIADLLAAGAGKAQGEVSDMVMALKQSGTVASQTGLTLEETTGTLAAFAEQSLLGSDAGTSFKTMLQRLSAPIGAAAAKMRELDISAYDAQGNFIGMEALAGQLRDRMGEMTDETRNATMATIFGSDAVRAAAIVYDNGAKGIQGWIDKTNDQGYAAETAAIKMDNLAGDLEKLKGALSTLFIEGGENGNSFLRDATQSAEGFVNALSELPDWANKAAFSLAAVTAIVGGSAFFGARVISGIASTRASLAALNLTAKQTAAITTGAKAGMVGMAVVAGGMFVDGMDDANLSARQLMEGLNALALGAEADVFKNLSGDVDSLNEAIEQSSGKGFWLDFVFGENAFTSTTDEIEALDEALAGLAETDLSKARDAYRGIADDWVAAGHSLDELAEKFPQYQTALGLAADAEFAASTGARSVSRALDEFEPSVSGADRSLRVLRQSLEETAEEAYTLDDAMDALFGTLDQSRAKDSWTAGLQGLTKELRDAKSATLDGSTKRGRDDREDIRRSIEELRAWSESVYNETGNAEQLEKNLLKGRDAIIEQGIAAKISGSEIEDYLNELKFTPEEIRTKVGLVGLTPTQIEINRLQAKADKLAGTKIDPKVSVDTDKAEVDVRKFYRWLEGLPPIVVSMFVDNLLDTQEGKLAGGGKTPSNRDREFATGGYTGNYPAQDVAGVVHGREFVFDADLTARYRGLFESIHRERKLPGYRDGGFVRQMQAQTATTNYYGGGAEIDYDRLTSSILQARPMYGDAHFTSAGDYEKAKRDHARKVAGGGVGF